MGDSKTDWLDGLYSERSQRAGVGWGGVTNQRAMAEGISLGGGFPDPYSMPINDMIDATRIVLERDGKWALQYAFGTGVPELVEQLLIKLKRDQGFDASPENILITHGGSQALMLIWEMFVDPGDAILCESPHFLGAVAHSRQNAADVYEIPLDDDGIVINELERVLAELRDQGRRAKFLYLVPNFQNPTGITYSLERRQRIVELAQEYRMPIVEDDAYHDLLFDGDRVPTFYSLDDQGLVLYLGTFSKIMSAGMRIGWVVANRDFIAHLSGLKADAGANAFVNFVAAEFASSGNLQEHIIELRSIYHGRRDAMLDALAAEMPEGVNWTRPTGGFFIWITLPEGVTGQQVADIAARQGVSVGLGERFFVNGGGEQNLRVSYSFNDADQINTGIKVIADAIRELQDT